MMRQGSAPEVMTLIVLLATMLSGCRSEYVYAGNLMVACVPCVLLYLVLNLKRER